MNKLLNVSSSPHVRCSVDTQSLMLDVAIAMLPAAAFGVYNFGFHALFVILATVAACIASEYVYEKLMHRPITIMDGSALVTGMILALNMPPEIPVWIPVIGGIFAIVVVKQLYGGLGQNFMNPALAARCFLLISFAGHMNNFSSAKLGFDSVSGATPLASMRAGGSVDLAAMVVGRIPGTIGEVSVIALLIGGIYLIVKKVISWKIPDTKEGAEITSFETLHDGMGHFEYTPSAQPAVAKVDFQGKKYEFTLPQALPNGYVLSTVNNAGAGKQAS